MKPCKFCTQQIDDLARKCPHCHSNQEPEKTDWFEPARLVISFVGLTSLILTILAGYFGAVGYKSFADVVANANDIQAKSGKLLADTENRLKGLEERVGEMRRLADEQTLRLLYMQFAEIVDDMIFDEIDNNPATLAALQSLRERVSKLETSQKAEPVERLEIIAFTTAIESYRARAFERAIEDLRPLLDNNFNKNRLAAATYYRWYDELKKDGRLATARDKLDEGIKHASRNNALTLKSSKQRFLSKLNLGTYHGVRASDGLTLDQQDLDTAERLFIDAQKLASDRSVLYYNWAAISSRKGDYDKALERLRMARERGDLQTKGDIDFFCKDSGFSVLRAKHSADLLDQLALRC